MNSDEFIYEVRKLVEWTESSAYPDEKSDLLSDYLTNLRNIKANWVRTKFIVDCYHKFTKVDPKQLMKNIENDNGEKTMSELIDKLNKENNYLKERLESLEEKILGDGLEYLLED